MPSVQVGGREGGEGLARLAARRELDKGEAAVRAVELFGQPHHLELAKGAKELLDLRRVGGAREQDACNARRALSYQPAGANPLLTPLALARGRDYMRCEARRGEAR